jgi:hypothetical protein
MPGTQLVDDNGNPVHQGPYLDYKAIVETTPGMQPTFSKVWIDGKSYSVSATEVTSPHKMGVAKDSDQAVVISSNKGNKMWELFLQKDEGANKNDKLKTTSSGIVIEGSYKGKAFVLPVNGIVKRLASPMYM